MSVFRETQLVSGGTLSPFKRAMANPVMSPGLGASTLLCWLAASDGNITPAQHKLLRDFAGEQPDPGCLELALTATREMHFEDILLACQAVRELPYEERCSLVKWAMIVASADNKIMIATNYVLRFISDLALVDLYDACERAKWRLPMPGDPSSPEWWEYRKSKPSSSGGGAGTKKKKRRGGMSVAEATDVLGLSSGASAEEVAGAFRKLASLHHPDRFAQADIDTQREAAKTFARIRTAFETLSQK